MNVNSSDKQVLGGLYTGLAKLKVIAINPSFDSLKAMGINAQQEPKYVSEENGVIKTRVDFYLSSKTVNLSKALKVSFWIENQSRQNLQKTKFEYINKFGVSAWSKDLESTPDYRWFSKEGMRKAYPGESNMLNFVKAWANINPQDQGTLDDISKLFIGDVSELLTIHKQIPENEVLCLLGVKDGKYQVVYDKYFDRAYRLNMSVWKKQLDGQGNEFKADYQNDFTFKPYIGSTQAISDVPTDVGNQAAAPVMEF